ncbi:MAG: hypothetical protein DCC43_10785 [Candidatus Brocadia sp.]|uniref:Uncharacterized protein n=1 Tax=Candidatus Brocadia fulgida TaxID=380242 RepID=A0A0M2UWZ1_9BACT|nr:MAG: hypothetical protein BROFUL_02308 [Candidatus Brocadia fulgida]MCE7912454.1 hypothetical protein [Candidatus Brocadia sp. AMX3]RIJ96975.1 MAG: hypothetical protein DCC43_10785 [Candidatus Brocadia sp.]
MKGGVTSVMKSVFNTPMSPVRAEYAGMVSLLSGWSFACAEKDQPQIPSFSCLVTPSFLLIITLTLPW